MSQYVIQIRKRDGEPPEIIASSGDIPAGMWTVHGGTSQTVDPDLPDWLWLQVSQRDPQGRYVEQTRHERPVKADGRPAGQ